MAVSAANLGSLYIADFHNVAWTQPGGPNTTVYPQQENSIYNPPQNPIPPGIFFCEATGLWVAGCGHFFDTFYVERDYDSTTSSSVCVVVCPLCSFIIQLIEPYEKWTDVTQYPIIVG